MNDRQPGTLFPGAVDVDPYQTRVKFPWKSDESDEILKHSLLSTLYASSEEIR
jgi:hypothetical protein